MTVLIVIAFIVVFVGGPIALQFYRRHQQGVETNVAFENARRDKLGE